MINGKRTRRRCAHQESRDRELTPGLRTNGTLTLCQLVNIGYGELLLAADPMIIDNKRCCKRSQGCFLLRQYTCELQISVLVQE